MMKIKIVFQLDKVKKKNLVLKLILMVKKFILILKVFTKIIL